MSKGNIVEGPVSREQTRAETQRRYRARVRQEREDTRDLLRRTQAALLHTQFQQASPEQIAAMVGWATGACYINGAPQRDAPYVAEPTEWVANLLLAARSLLGEPDGDPVLQEVLRGIER